MLFQLVDFTESALMLYFHSFGMLGNRAFSVNPSSAKVVHVQHGPSFDRSTNQHMLVFSSCIYFPNSVPKS